MKRTTLVLIAALAAPLMVMADEPTTRPADRPSTQPSRPFGRGDGGGGRFGFGRRGDRDAMQDNRPPTQPEIDETLAFVKQNFPNHFELFNQLPDNSPFREKVALPKMVGRYRQLSRLQDQMPGAYDALLRQAKTEDTALGLARDKSENKPQADERLHSFISNMVDQSLQDRKDRIARLESDLAEQKSKLAEDEQRKDKLIDDQMKRTEQEFIRLSHGAERGEGLRKKDDASDTTVPQK